ncbi:hypothetical protein D3C80_1792870 [compost metagenome]
MRFQPRHDQLGIAARVDDDGLLRHRVADDRAVALQGADGEGFSNDGGLLGLHGDTWSNG